MPQVSLGSSRHLHALNFSAILGHHRKCLGEFAIQQRRLDKAVIQVIVLSVEFFVHGDLVVVLNHFIEVDQA